MAAVYGVQLESGWVTGDVIASFKGKCSYNINVRSLNDGESNLLLPKCFFFLIMAVAINDNELSTLTLPELTNTDL